MLFKSLLILSLSLLQSSLTTAFPTDGVAELLHLGTYDHPIEARHGLVHDFLHKRASSSTSSATTSSTNPPDSSCTNSAVTRSCWNGNYSISTNYDSTWPTTGKTVTYNLEIKNVTLAPDGHARTVYAVNGQYPGPVITCNWGDTLQITVKNSLTTNGTSMHWHGIRQWKTNSMDGTNGITECPLAPGQSRTYTFLATQFGTTWYHSHYESQYTDGVVGSIVINGPASSNYDFDLGPMPITDWYYTPAETIFSLLEHAQIRGPPPGDNILINGTNVNATGGGQYNKNTLTQGKKYRLRLINTSTNDNFQVGLDGHPFTVISADFTPIVPWTTQWLFLAVGQRYDVIITANQNIDNYWFHVVPQAGCSSNNVTNAVSIFSYTGAPNALPSSANRNNAPSNTVCTDPNSNLVPYVKLNVPTNGTIPQSSNLDVGFALVANTNNQTLVQWNLNFTAIVAPWSKPTLEYVREGDTNYPQSMNLINLPQANTWSVWVIQALATQAPPQPHPMHLHGHDFYVLGAGTGTFNNSQTLNYNNPPRRDVAMVPASGYLVVAFITDNPGAWLMHCHLAWHIGLGLGAQFLEQSNNIPNPYNTPGWQNQCTTWNSYYTNALYQEQGSGL